MGTTMISSGSLQNLANLTTSVLQWCPHLQMILSMHTSTALRMALSSMRDRTPGLPFSIVPKLFQLNLLTTFGPKPWASLELRCLTVMGCKLELTPSQPRSTSTWMVAVVITSLLERAMELDQVIQLLRKC